MLKEYAILRPVKKLAILSDLHLDVNQFDEQYKQILIQTLQEQRITDIHLAGDISNDFERLSKPFSTSVAGLYRFL